MKQQPQSSEDGNRGPTYLSFKWPH